MSLQLRNPIVKTDITWNSNWISEFESPWGILEKVKYANYVTSNDLLRFWGTDKVKKLKTRIGEVHRNLVTLQGFNDDLIQNSIGFSLHEHNRKALKKLLGQFHDYKININKYFRNELYFCNECLNDGHHSLIFQCKFIKKCPYHNIDLTRGCVKCKTQIPYIFSDNFTEEPFLCECGHLWLSNSFSLSFCSENKKYEIDSGTLYDWTHLNHSQKEYLNRCRFFDGTDFNKTEGVLENLLSIIDDDYDSTDHHKTTTSSFNLNSISSNFLVPKKFQKNLITKHKYLNRKEESWSLLRNNYKYMDQYAYFYSSSRKIVSSIERHIRKSIFPEHKNCVKRLVGLMKEKDVPFPNICPYAFAYVYWKKSIDGIESFYKVDRFGYPDRGNNKSVEIASVVDRPLVDNFINQWIEYFEEMDISQLAALNRTLNKLVGTLVLEHYYNWLSIAPEYAAKKEEAYYKSYIYQNLPFFTFVFPSNKSGDIEFHWWVSEKKLMENVELICPYPTKKHKKIKPTEKSHTPLKLFLEDF